jgi:hypothetical protein
MAWYNFFGSHRFAIDNCAIEFDLKKIDFDAYIDGTPPSQFKRRKFYNVRIGNNTEKLPNKIEEQTGLDGQLITTLPQLNGLGIKIDHFEE